MKVLSIKYGIKEFNIVLNCVDSEGQARSLFQKLSMICERFLEVKLNYLGYVFKDKKLVDAVRKQRPVILLYPYSKSSRCIYNLRDRLCSIEPAKGAGFKRFLNRLFGKGGRIPNEEI